MALTWPWALAALLAVPLLLLARWLLQRRRRRLAVRVSSLALIRAAVPGPSAWRRRIPVALFLAALALLGLGVARPHASMLVPTSSTSIVLAIDVSQSMCSTDVPPNRMTAAREAAREFVLAQDDGTRIGLVAFSGISGLLVEPTTDKQVLLDAIDTLRTARGTAIGQAILTAIDAIAESNPDVLPTGVELPDPGDLTGQYAPDTIVVLTDGANTQGVTPQTAAEQAKARRIRIYTIGFGTTEPAPIVCSVDQIDQGTIIRPPDGRFGGGGGGRRAQLIDEETLTAVADSTGGKYFRAEDAEQLGKVLGDLPSTIVTQRRDVELTVWFVLAAALLAFAAVGLSLRWNRT